jgi:O-antigen/teichoic acid export membrane protein
MTFLLNVLFARFFAASISGQVFYLFAVFTFIVQAVGFSLEAGVSYYHARGEIPGNTLTGIMLAWSIAAGIIVLLAFIIVKYFNPDLSYPVIYPVCFVFGNILINYGNAYCNSKFRFLLPNTVSVSVTILLILFLIVDPSHFIDFYFYSFVLQGTLLFIFILSGEKLKFSFSISDIKPVVQYSFAAFIANMLTLVLNRIDYVFVKEYASAIDLGNYIQVSRISQLCVLLPSMVSTVLFPYMVTGEKNDMKLHVKKISKIFFIIFSSLSLFLTITGYWLFPFLYGPSFQNMYVPFILMAPGIICICSMYPYSTYFAANNNIKSNIRAIAISLVFVLAGNFMLVPLFGINAAAGVRSLGYIIYQFSLLSIFKNEQKNI